MNLDRLMAEINASYNGCMNALITRRDHPSYGYTKTYIRNLVRRFMALCEAYILAAGLHDAPGSMIESDIVVWAMRQGSLGGAQELYREWYA